MGIWTGLNIASLLVNCAAFIITFFLFLKVFKNYKWGMVMSLQRKLRIATLISLFVTQAFLLLARGALLVEPTFFEKYNCDSLFYVFLTVNLVYLSAVTITGLFINLSTINRYERLNFITATHPSYRKIAFLRNFLIAFACVTVISVLFSSLTGCFLANQRKILQPIQSICIGLFTISVVTVDTILNLKMISSTLANQSLKNVTYKSTRLGKFLKTLGYKRQLYLYFWILLSISVTNVVIAVFLSMTEILSAEMEALLSYITISVGVPIHIFFTFKILDLFLLALKAPTHMVIQSESPESGENSISFFASSNQPFQGSSAVEDSEF